MGHIVDSSPWSRGLVLDPAETRYLYLRTRTTLDNAGTALFALVDSLPRSGRTAALSMGGHGQAWEDGLALKTEATDTPAEMAEAMQEALDQFDAWAIHDGLQNCAETLGGGPVSQFLRNGDWNRTGEYPAYSQVFLVFRRNDKDPDATVGRIRACLGDANCRPVFHFRDGRILLVYSAAPAKALLRRCERHIRELHRISICGWRGDACSSLTSNRDPWEQLEFGTPVGYND